MLTLIVWAENAPPLHARNSSLFRRLSLHAIERLSAAENDAERAENLVSGSGAMKGRGRKRMSGSERERNRFDGLFCRWQLVSGDVMKRR